MSFAVLIVRMKVRYLLARKLEHEIDGQRFAILDCDHLSVLSQFPLPVISYMRTYCREVVDSCWNIPDNETPAVLSAFSSSH